MFHIVEDTSFARNLLEEMLRKLNTPSLCFSSAQDYIDYVNSTAYQPPVAVFTDIMMPDINGYKMMGRLLKTHPDMKFIVATSEPRIRSEFKHLACIYLAKPYALGQLKAVVSRVQQCHQCGASTSIGCAYVDDKKDFNIKQWSCPHPAKE